MQVFGGTFFAWIIIAILFGGLWGCPKYNVYSKRLGGEATLAEAESARQVTVRQAQADLDASRLKAQAEVERARGVKQANDIIQSGLGGPEGYLRWLYIQGLNDNKDKTVIYMPTEAGIPILEAGKRK